MRTTPFRRIFLPFLLSSGLFFFTGFPLQAQDEEIRWLDFNQAVKLNSLHPKKIVIDIYTKWCGWCKRMDATTYSDPAVVSYINKNYYAVRLDAETADTFYFNNHAFFNSDPGHRGSVNELAGSLMDGKQEYPTIIYLDDKFNRLSIAPGYMTAEDILFVLRYFNEEKYKTMNFDDYKRSIQ